MGMLTCPVSQPAPGIRAYGRGLRQGAATLTSPMSANALVFATNGSGGGDTKKVAAGTTVRDAGCLVTCRGHNALLLSARAAGSSRLLHVYTVSCDELAMASSSSKTLLRTGF